MVKLSQLDLPTRFLMKKDKNRGGDDNKNNCNTGGYGEQKKEKDPSIIQRIELENKESNDGEITKNSSEEALIIRRSSFTGVRQAQAAAAKIQKLYKGYRVRKNYLAHRTVVAEELLKDEDDTDGDGGDDDDNNGGGGGKRNNKDRDRDGDGNGHKDKGGRDDDRGEMKGKSMDFMGEALFGYNFGYHAGNEHEYPIGQLECAQQAQSSDFKCLFYHPIMIS